MKDYEAGKSQSWNSEPWSSRPPSPHSQLSLCRRTSPLNLFILNYPLTQHLSSSLSSFPTGQLYGLEKFWAFLKYSKAKNLDIDPKLQEYLGKFRRLEDFRVDVSFLKRKLDQRSGKKRGFWAPAMPLTQGPRPALPSSHLGLVFSVN